jgi:hypothetical protein
VTAVHNFEKLLVEVRGEGSNKTPRYQAGIWMTPKALYDWLCECAITAHCNIDSIKDDPKREDQLIKAISSALHFGVDEKEAHPAVKVSGYLYPILQLIEDAGEKYSRRRSSL